MAEIHSRVMELPESCKSAARHMEEELAKEDAEESAEDVYANLSEGSLGKLTKLERTLSGETGEKVALVAYKLS